jgi:hypothetical protein
MKVEGTCGEVEIPETANGWELYSTMPGANLAAKRLAKAAAKAVKAETRGEAIKIMGAALTKETKYGARDTEPRCHAEHILEKGRGGSFAWAI